MTATLGRCAVSEKALGARHTFTLRYPESDRVMTCGRVDTPFDALKRCRIEVHSHGSDYMAGQGRADPRPLSPHLQIWKWHWTMAGSIFHRVSGVGLYGGAFLIGAWLIALATGPEAYAFIEMIAFSLPGQIILFLWSMAVLYHLANGLRHLIWDGPMVGFNPGVASLWSMFNFAFAIIGAAAIWSLASFY